MIVLGLGGNLFNTEFGMPCQTLEVALEVLARAGAPAVRRSRWYRSAPVPDDGQPWYTNAVAELATALPPSALLALLLETEASLGRVRGARNTPRTVDLDLIAYHDHISGENSASGAPELPHPRMHERAFVLHPLAEIAPGWRHPVSGRSVEELIAALAPGQRVVPLAEP